ncbi:MAG: hypothetical protein A2945_05055 [Candidatus Liptonbacteria bacterium RIFCSPLOWO2_01_FULL_52_25]|uniref:Oxidoreductase n=1 Tax=Candidatus Liptonbacteria bacterium RIFCSPLOWO2_01_FULL_52_25 TaxID=1798650 RepID=A0A1G2CD51_9BACT|nr:MAG: hypothetical protein A2945_05055 [Candidatus Liptonbacteria bacterium RIFCSPLOWO2_01_FULL_52_25]
MIGFPLWLQITHFLNIILMTLLARSGLQILADHPKLYWNDDTTPGSEWIKFGKKVMPKDELWTSIDEAEYINPILGITGGNHNLGSARRWHFFAAILFVANGLTYVTLLFVTGQWVRLVPTSWSIFPAAFNNLVEYLSFRIPPASSFTPYDPLQQLTYFAVVFIFAPFMVFTGLALSPALAGRFPWYIKIFGGRQAARSLHFLGLVGIMGFLVIHLLLVALVNGRANLLNITLGGPSGDWNLAVAIFSAAIVFTILLNIWITWYTLHHQRKVQNALDPFINFFTRLLSRMPSRQHYAKKDISPYFRVNGRPPKDEKWQHLAKNNFKDWKLNVGGLVKNKLALSLDDLRTSFSKSEQITKHNCIQGWSAVAEWGGVPVAELIKRAEPLPNARYIVFHAFDKDDQGLEYYTSYTIEEMMMPQSLLAYEMNGQPLPIVYGAPLRVRAESRLGFKMVKYLKSMEFIADRKEVGSGYGGYRDDVQFFDNVATI